MGKVHGSLARAGKVKSATPKVGYFISFLPPFDGNGMVMVMMMGHG